MARNELRHLRLVLAIANAGADDNAVKDSQIQRVSFGQLRHRDAVPALFNNLTQTLADATGMAVGR